MEKDSGLSYTPPRSRWPGCLARIISGLLVIVILLAVIVMSLIEKYIKMPGENYAGPRAELESTADRELAQTLRHDVTMLSDVLGERNLTNAPDRLAAAEAWISQELVQSQGDSRKVTRLTYTVGDHEVANLEATRPGLGKPEEIVIIGAHYDSAPGTAGANDNASGVAALLALARLTHGMKFERTLRFVAFVNEEPPYFQSGEMGSQVYALGCKRADENIVGMLCLETVGYYSEAPGSQKYPPLVDKFYPNIGNFIAFVGNDDSRDLVRQCVGEFRKHAKIRSEGIAAPPGVEGIDLSDHASFWEFGYPALMITDTAPFRYPYYHTAQDLPEHLDFGQMTQVVKGLVPVIECLAESHAEE